MADRIRHCAARLFALVALIALTGAMAFPASAQTAPIVMKIDVTRIASVWSR